MELSILLAEQIFSLLLMVLTGYVVRKLNVVPKSGRKVLASIVLYVSAPCIVFDSFQIEYSSEKLFGLVVGFAAACIALAVFIWAASVCKKIFHLSASEQTSVTYANTGNMIIPLVNNILGSEYVLYTSPYNCTQTALLWIHAYNLITGNKNVQLKKILLNPNIIAMVAGLIFFLLGIQLPEPLHHTVTQLGSLIGPLSMLNVGFIMAEENLLDVFKGRKIWLGDDSASDHSADDHDLLRAPDGDNIQISPDEKCIADLTVGSSSTDSFIYCTVCRDCGQ